jgi:hypothetical protein
MKQAKSSRTAPSREAAMLASEAAVLERAGRIKDARAVY